MRTLTQMLLVIVVLAGTAAAQIPACPTTEVNWLQRPASCIHFDKIFSDWGIFDDPTLIDVLPDDIWLLWGGGPLAPSLTFLFGDTPGAGVTRTNPPGNNANFAVNYIVTVAAGSPLYIGGVNLAGVGSANAAAGSNVDITKQLCIGGAFAPGADVTACAASGGTLGTQLHVNTPFAPAGDSTGIAALSLGVRDIFQISSGSAPAGTATLISATNTFHQIPEPGTYALIGSALLAVAFLRKKIAARRT